MRAADPDAMWKPGFTGEVVHPKSSIAADVSRRRRRRRWPVSLLVVFVALLVAVGLWVITGGGTTPPRASSRVERIPTQVDRRWSADVPGQVFSVIGSRDVVVAAALGRNPTITAIRRRDGTILWSKTSAQATVASMAIFGDVIVYDSSPRGGHEELVGLDAHSGRVRWSRLAPDLDGGATVTDRNVVIHHLVGDRESALDLVDPTSGSIRATIDAGDGLMYGEGRVQVRRGDTIELYDDTSFAMTARVSVPELRGRGAWVVPAADGWFVGASGSLLLLDRSGAVRSSAPIDSIGDPEFAPDVVAIDDGAEALVYTNDGVALYGVDDGRLVFRWRKRAWVIDRRNDMLALSRFTDGNGQPADGPIELVDATTGQTTWRSAWASTVTGTMLADNGFTVPLPDRMTGRASNIVAVDLFGNQLWNHTVEARDIALIPDGLVESGPAPGPPGRTTITLFG